MIVREGSNGNDGLSIAGYVKECFRLYANGRGRSRRKEYWSFQLFLLSIGLSGTVCATFCWLMANVTGWSLWVWLTMALVLFWGLAVLVCLAPAVSVTIRRFHDVGLSGWWVVLWFVPLLGAIFVLVVALRPSQPGLNAFGRSPKAIA